MHHIELRHLRTVAALRGASTLVEAAERVYLTQSALSHQLKDLEERLGCTLFIRKTRPMRFTSAGKRLLQLADEVLPLVQTASLDLARLAGGHSGRLHMSIECHSCFEWLLPAINAYREDWPEVELDISGGFHFQPLPALLRGDLDLVVTADPIEEPGLAYLPLFGYEAQMALAVDHPLTEKEWIDPEDVAEETLITYPIDRSRQDIFTRFLDPAGVEPARVRTAELTPMMVQLVRQWPRSLLPTELGAARVHRARLRRGQLPRRRRDLAEPLCRRAHRATRRALHRSLRRLGQGHLLPEPRRHRSHRLRTRSGGHRERLISSVATLKARAPPRARIARRTRTAVDREYRPRC